MRRIVALLFVLLGAAEASAAPCTGWLEPKFWKTAALADVERCLATSKVNARAEDGWTPLHHAAAFSTAPAIVTALLKAGADARAVDEDGKKPVDHAENNEALKSTDAYWRLNDAAYGD